MTQKELILKYIEEFGSITPARMGERAYKGEWFGSETSKRCREMRAEGILRSEPDGKFEKFYLTGKHDFSKLKPIIQALCCTSFQIFKTHDRNCKVLIKPVEKKELLTLF